MTKGIGSDFMYATQHKFLDSSPQSRGLPQPPLELACDEDAERIPLPPPEALRIPALDLTAAIQNRRSLRRYSPQPLALEELSYLLWCTQGVKQVIDAHATLRTVPSAGARHAFETYLLLNRVEGLAPGLYRFLAISHELTPIDLRAGVADDIAVAALGQSMVKAGAAAFIWTAVAPRMMWRYGERGYRYMHLDAGHVCQNLYLSALAVGCGTCAIAAFEDEALNAALGIDGESHFVVYMATVGKQE